MGLNFVRRSQPIPVVSITLVRDRDKLNMKLNRDKSKPSMKRNYAKSEPSMKRNYDKSKPSTKLDKGNGHDRTHMKDRGVQDHLSSSNNHSHVHHSVRTCSLSCDR